MKKTPRKSNILPVAFTQTERQIAGIALIFALTSVEIVMAGPNQQAVANALNTCNNQFVFNEMPSPSICNAGSNPANLQSLTPDQIFGMGSQTTRVNGGSNTQPSDYSRFKPRNPLGGGSGDEDFSRLNFWSNIDNDFGSLNTTDSQRGYNFDNHNFVFGADYRVLDSWVVGGSFAYRYNNATFNANSGQTVTNGYTGNLYTSYYITDALHVEATAAYGGYDYDTSRNITLQESGTTVAKGSTTGNQYAFSWGGGYDFNYQALTVAPYLRGDYINQAINGYSESGSIAAVQFAQQTIESLTSTLGIQTGYAISVPWGVLTPQLRGEWHHQYMDGQRQLQASFISDPTGQVFTLSGSSPTRDYYTFGAEVSTVMARGVSAFLAYETLQGYSNVNSNKLMLGGRLEF